MRKQINGLVLLVQEEMRTGPFETAPFVCNAAAHSTNASSAMNKNTLTRRSRFTIRQDRHQHRHQQGVGGVARVKPADRLSIGRCHCRSAAESSLCELKVV